MNIWNICGLIAGSCFVVGCFLLEYSREEILKEIGKLLVGIGIVLWAVIARCATSYLSGIILSGCIVVSGAFWAFICGLILKFRKQEEIEDAF